MELPGHTPTGRVIPGSQGGCGHPPGPMVLAGRALHRDGRGSPETRTRHQGGCSQMVEKAAWRPRHMPSATGGTPVCFLTYQQTQGPLPWVDAENTRRSTNPFPRRGCLARRRLLRPRTASLVTSPRVSPMTEHRRSGCPGQHTSHLCPGHRHSHVRGATSRPRSEGDASPNEGTSSCSRATQLAEHSTPALRRPPGKDGTGRRSPQDPACARSQGWLQSAGGWHGRVRGRRTSGRQSGTGRLTSPSRMAAPILHN